MQEIINSLIQCAELDILDFGYDVISDMANTGRKFPFYVMSYLKEGEAFLRIHERKIITPRRSVILVRAGELHDHVKTSDEDAIFLWWHFNFMISKQVDILRLFSLPTMVLAENSETFEKYFLAYMDILKTEPNISSLIFRKARALDVFACLLENFIHSDESQLLPSIPEHFFNILEEIISRPDARMNLEQLSARYHMHPTYISNKFQEHFGLSPICLHRRIIIETARERLITTGLSINEIATELGFRNTSAFTRFFSRKTGVPPGKFRDNQYPNPDIISSPVTQR
jgi:AraC-like DNA-binding protein